MKRTICTLAIATTLAAAASAAALQEKPAAPAESSRSEQFIKVVQVKHADASEISQVLRGVGGVRISVDQRTNTLVIVGPAPEVMEVEKVIVTLDVPVTNTVKVDRKTRYFDLTLPVDKSTLKLVGSVVSRGTSIAADGNMLVVQGRERDLDEVTALVAKLNETAATRKLPDEWVGPRSIQTHFYFISASFLPYDKSASPEDATPLPRALASVAHALTRSGFHRPSLLATLFVNAKEVSRGDNFRISGQAGDIKISISGRVGQSVSSDSVEISVSAKLTVPTFAEGISNKGVKIRTRSGSQSLFDIETKLNVKLGDYVILAAAPSSSGDGRAIALVVRATAGN